MADPAMRYQVARVGVPEWLARATPIEIESHGEDAYGGQVDWHFATPWVFRALASPLSHESLLRAPAPTDRSAHRKGYWTSLLYLLAYRLGWPRPDRGLKWWLDNGLSSDDPTLQLVAHVWAADGAMGQLAEWFKHNPRTLADHFAEHCGYEESPGQQAFGPGQREPFDQDTGPDELHLSAPYLLGGPLRQSDPSVHLLKTSASEGRATLLYPSMIGWYRALADAGSQLPALPNRSWRVDVVVRPVGWLGTYRRSRKSGLWFTGRHSAHIAGT